MDHFDIWLRRLERAVRAVAMYRTAPVQSGHLLGALLCRDGPSGGASCYLALAADGGPGVERLDPQLLREVYAALDELTTIFELPDLYPFQTTA